MTAAAWTLGPLLAEGFDDRRQHQPLDVGPGSKVSAQLVPLVLVEGSLEERSEDRGLDLTPLFSPGVDQQADLLVGQGKRCGLIEQATVKAEHRLHENGRETARLHRGPERAGHFGKRGDPAFLSQPAEHCREAVLGQQSDILGKKSEQAAHQEMGDEVGGVAGMFERSGQLGKLGGDLARDLRRAAAGVEGERLSPYLFQPLADLCLGQIAKPEPMGPRVGEGNVRAALAREV